MNRDLNKYLGKLLTYGKEGVFEGVTKYGCLQTMLTGYTHFPTIADNWARFIFFSFQDDIWAVRSAQLHHFVREKITSSKPHTYRCIHLPWFSLGTWCAAYCVTVSICSSSCHQKFTEFEICYLVLHHFSRSLWTCWSVGHRIINLHQQVLTPASHELLLLFFFLLLLKTAA